MMRSTVFFSLFEQTTNAGMPRLQIETNFELSQDQQQHIASTLTKEFAKIAGKDEKWFVITLSTKQFISMGHDANKPAAMAAYTSIGAIEGKQKAFTQAFCAAFKEHVSGERVYITFHDIAGKNWGWNDIVFENL